jgi:DNA-binding transcriptional MerR regulator
MSGQRRYDPTVLYRLEIIQRAGQLGFTLTEIRQLFFGFRDVTRASERWPTLSRRKLADLDQLMDGIKAVRALIKKLMTKCRCDTLHECGKGVLWSRNRDVLGTPLPATYRHEERSSVSLRN